MTPCIPWAGSIDRSNGYGYISLGYHKKVYAHRAVYEKANGAIQDGLVIDHECRRRDCVNPDHLRAVTRAVNSTENSVGPAALNLAKTHCVNGHEFTHENTYCRPGSRHRRCRMCRKAEQVARNSSGLGWGGKRERGQ